MGICIMKDDYAQLTRNVTIAGITIKEFADLIRVKPASVTNLKQEDKTVPKSMLIISILMRELARAEVDFRKYLECENFVYKTRSSRKSKIEIVKTSNKKGI